MAFQSTQQWPVSLEPHELVAVSDLHPATVTPTVMSTHVAIS